MTQSDGTAPGRIGWIGILVVVLALNIPCRQAHSQAPPQPPELAPMQAPRPWADGVSDAEQAVALELYRAANAEFVESRFAEAFVKYRQAIRHWDHPAIRYNIAICLMNLGELVEAKDNLDRSLVYGDLPLGVEHYEQGLRLRARLAAQLANLEIASQEPGIDVALDGELLFKAPGAAHAVVMPGMHQIVATGPALPALSHSVVLIAGTLTRFTIERKVKLVGGDIRHALELEEHPTTVDRGPLSTAGDAPVQRPAGPQVHPRPGTPQRLLQAGPRPTGFTWEAGLGYALAWARSGGALYNAWRDVVAGTRTASMEWSDPIAAWNLGLGAGRWISNDLALSMRLVWTSFGFTDGTTFNVRFVGGSLQYWPTDHFWIGGGLGYASTGTDPAGDGTEYHSRLGLGQGLRVGCTLNTGSKITINVSAELTSIIFSTTSGPEVATVSMLFGIQPSMAWN